jgi:hypothetical protein
MFNRRMNPELQEQMINRALVNAGIDPEVFDTSAHIDRNLHADENLKNIKRMHGIGNRPQETYGHQNRTLQADLHGEFYQIGRSQNDIDKQMSAMIPGVRYTAWGTTYTERRKNRSDKPGGRT